MGLKCRFCCCNRSASVFIAGCLSLFQAAVMFTLALLAIRTHDCSWSMQGDPFSYGMYLIYFWNRECGNVQWAKLNITVGEDVQPVFQGDTSFAVQRTYTLAWWYLLLSVFWAVTSVGLITSSCCKPKGKTHLTIIYLPHVVATLANVAIDIVGASLYWNDVKNTGSVQKFLRFLELVNVDQIAEVLPDYDTDITRLPSFLMMIVAARLFVFPIINAWFSIIITAIWCEISSSINKKNKQDTVDVVEPEAPRIIPVINEPEPTEIMQPVQAALQASEPPPNASEAMKTAVTMSVQEKQDLEPEVEHRPLSGFNDADFIRRLDGIVEQGLQQYQESGLSNVNASNIPPEDDPRVWTGLLYPTVPSVIAGSSSNEKKMD